MQLQVWSAPIALVSSYAGRTESTETGQAHAAGVKRRSHVQQIEAVMRTRLRMARVAAPLQLIQCILMYVERRDDFRLRGKSVT